MPSRRAIVLLPIAIGLALASQDTPPGQPPVIKVGVKQVLVPVVVTDKKGHHVQGLKANDFEISEDGVAQKIVAFTASQEPLLAPPQPAAQISSTHSAATQTAPPDPKQTYLICVDTLHSAFTNFGRVTNALRKFFAQEQSGDSMYALVSLGRKVRVLQDSTNDPQKILAALQPQRFTAAIQDTESAHMVMEAQKFREQMSRDYCKFCACEAYGSTTDSPQCSGATGRLTATLLSVGERSMYLDQDFLLGLKELVKATASMPTGKAIIFVSDGFNRFPGRELYAIMDGYGPKNRLFQFNPRDAEPPLQAVLKLAAASNVRFYTIDSRGLYAAASLGSSSFDASNGGIVPEKVDQNQMTVAREDTDALSQLARQTGGTFFENDNDLFKGIQRAFADSREYYMLAYSPTNQAADGKFRKIAVEVKKPKVTITAKQGYWATE